MNKKIIKGMLFFTAILSLGLTGCGESKKAKEARLQGIKQIEEGNYSEAVSSFDTALEEADGIVNSFELDILKYRGEAEFRLGDYTASAHTYGILAEVDGKPEYLYYKAASAALSGDLAAASEDYNKAFEIDTVMDRNIIGKTLAQTALGQAYAESGDYEQAVSYYQDVIESGAATAALFNQMGVCMIKAGQYDQAISYFEQGIAQGDESITKELMMNKGAAYEYKGDFQKALETFQSYAAGYGSTPELEKEIAFLQSR